MFRLKNPIPQAIRDSTKLRNIYRGFNLVPYAGSSSTSSHQFLKLLSDLYELSPSHAACIDDLRNWAFEGTLDITRPLPGGRMAEISETEKSAFFDFLQSLGIDDAGLIETTGQLFTAKKKTGTAYLHYREVRIGGTLRIFLESVDPLNVMFLNTLPDEPRAVVISPDFFNPSGFQTEPRLVRVYPDFSEDGRVRETVFVTKNKRDYSDWYGRPDSLQSLYWQFVEFCIANLTAKVSSTEVSAKAIVTMQSPNPEVVRDKDKAKAVFLEIAEELRKMTTNAGDFDQAESLGVVRYPFGGTPPELLKLDINRDTEYLKAVTGIASDYIFSAHRWSKVLNGFERAKSGIGGNILKDEFLTRNTSIIKPTQTHWERFWVKVFGVIAESAGRAEMAQRAIRFEDKVSSLVESIGQADKANGKDALNGGGSPDTGTGEPADTGV